jgi:hypothetical protein
MFIYPHSTRFLTLSHLLLSFPCEKRRWHYLHLRVKLAILLLRCNHFQQLGLYANPIYSEAGDYPAYVRKAVDLMSKTQGYSRSRLPYFSPEEVGYNHSLSINRPTKRGKEKSPTDEHCPCEIEMNDHLLACQ